MDLLILKSENYFIDKRGISCLNVVINNEESTISFADKNTMKKYTFQLSGENINLYDKDIFIADIKKYNTRTLIMREYVGNEITYQALIM